ncbi:unnamed protein product [Brugia pahangi]|uniref:Zf-AD domain-containing protein n=1 Tax=Brugia pahangi TaxID=6280 RepID=A0A0N4TWA5_BRUPA|nr:unnamed protein product [Brugia pahangi]
MLLRKQIDLKNATNNYFRRYQTSTYVIQKIYEDIIGYFWLAEMERRSDIISHDTPFPELCKNCIEVDIPAPFAAEMTSNASQALEDSGFEEEAMLLLSIMSVHKRKLKKASGKDIKVVCKGCGAEMKSGAFMKD